MSDPSPESSGTATAPVADDAPVTPADILVEQSSSDEVLALAGAIPEGMASLPETATISVEGGDKLVLSDVLPGVDVTDPNLGAYLKIETLGGNTVISIDADGAGPGAAVPVVTLHGVTDVTLQDLLNTNPIIT